MIANDNRIQIVLAAGAIGSPQILQLSGIGPGALLADMGGYLDQASRRSLCLYII